MHRHDYPFIAFEILFVSRSSSSQNAGALVTDCHEIIEKRKEELISDLKMFEKLTKIISNNIENDKLYESYKVLKQPLINETIACNEALNAKT
ncbi:33839_t:CDS:2 [Gigaspora margarita]|uniref:33839_t:CDS:1 n=1 Tax=Gigaspora margarita TaxID=4874 RepID=A0ABN7UY60_GIGMA|nr:33839_t:CDS:2 [Gigaspora margarita]